MAEWSDTDIDPLLFGPRVIILALAIVGWLTLNVSPGESKNERAIGGFNKS
jgi:hypothetical protein